MHSVTLFYCALVNAVFITISADSSDCSMPKLRSLDPDTLVREDFIKDIQDFHENFEQRFESLKRSVKRRLPYADKLDVSYLLFTRDNLNEPYELKQTDESIEGSNFNSSWPTAIIVHGYTKKFDLLQSSISDVDDKLFEREPYNAIFVNYTNQIRPLFSETVANSYLVSKNIGLFIKFLMKHGMKAEQLHIIGHSLGGQVSGNVGNYVNNIGRITVMDPGSPIFEDFPHKYRVSHHDANFVDVIHSSSLPFPKGIGYLEPAGHQDFYPNGGGIQPGCEDNNTETEYETSIERDKRDLTNALCDHSRAVFMYLASICVKGCQFIGVMCDSYENFLAGRCTKENSPTAVMGFDAKKNESLEPNSKFYLTTGPEFPFCQRNN